MRLSRLQRHILLECLDGKRRRVVRTAFMDFYRKQPGSPSAKDQQDSVTKSLERLIDKGLMVGYGRRTPKKWFIDEVALTAKGRKETKKLLGKQQKLPLKSKGQSTKDEE